MKYLTLDCETTCLKLHPKILNGNPFAAVNFLCCVGLLDHEGNYYHYNIQYNNEPYGDNLNAIQSLFDNHDCIIGFNLKFDLHWLHRYGISFRTKSVMDCQLLQFILSNQSSSYPSLHETAQSYGLEGKLDVVKTEYWDKGIDTEKIPEPILRTYLEQDVQQTFQLFLRQKKNIPSSKSRLISLQNADLLTLLEIEQNGMLYDVETSQTDGDKLQGEIKEIDEKLIRLTGYDSFNPNSGDHISVILYGGSLSIPCKISYVYTYKDGRTITKEKNGEKELKFPQMVAPPKGSELKKEGFYATNAETLNNLRASGVARKIIALLLRRGEIEKLRGTYLHGIPKLIKENGWEPNIIHGQLNQCVAITGRLSSSKPNLQNMDGGIGYLFRSRYAN
jgi:DNA polymerase-1